MDRETLLDLIPAYALGALDPDERAEFEAWLSGDAEAQRLLADYRAIADALVLTAPAKEAPGHLQADLRRRLAEERGHQTMTRRQSPSRMRNPALLRWLAAAAVIVLALGAILFLSVNRVNAPNGDAAHLFDDIAAQTNTQHIPVTPGEGQTQLTGELVSDGTQAVIQVWQLPALSSDKTFELWLVDESGPKSGGLIEAEPAGEPTYIVLPLDKPLDEYQAFGVSIEPSGGSPQAGPTGPRVFGVSLEQS